jgi:signal transduction histidine kinase
MTRSRLYAWGVVVLSLATLVGLTVFTDVQVPRFTTFAFWCILLAASELLPVTLGFGTSITMGFPTLLAASILFSPPVAMAIAGLGSFDPREIRREIELHRAAFNRAQVMLAVGAASGIFHSGLDPFNPGTVAIAAGAHIAINLGLVAMAVHMDRRIPFLEALRMIPPRPIAGFAMSTALLATLGTATALAYQELKGQVWVVIAILIPLLFARMTISGAKAQQELFERVRAQQEALLAASEKVFQEREKERARIAESIHDTSLQMLAAAAYGCSNTIELINAGKEDRARSTLTSVQDAVQNAIGGLREALVDLRRSAVEEGGLVETVTKFTDELSTLWGARVIVAAELAQEPPTPVAMAAFQILQEGLVNALKHSQSESVTIEITEQETMLVLIVRDDGVGFDTETNVGSDHLGMRLMKERAEGVGGKVTLESTPGRGTRLEAVLPAGVSVA